MLSFKLDPENMINQISTKTPTCTVNIMCALKCEAKALIHYFNLKQVREKPFALYRAQWKADFSSVCLVNLCVSGIGAMNMANAVGWIAAQSKIKTQWFNVGVAGHKNAEIASLFRVHALLSDSAKKIDYLPNIVKTSLKDCMLKSNNEVVNQYPENAMVDMEGYAFYQSGLFHNYSDFIHIVKVISDNESHHSDKINAELISQYVQQNIQEIVQYISQCFILFDAIDDTVEFIEQAKVYMQSVSRTKSQDIQLDEYLRQLIVFDDLSDVFLQELCKDVNIKSILARLRNEVEKKQIKLDSTHMSSE